MGDAGSCITDPGFNSTICAVTDANTDPTDVGGSYTTANYSGTNAWASDSKHFYWMGPQGYLWLGTFDPVHGTVTSIVKSTNGVGLGLLSDAEFSFSNPNLAIGVPTWPQIDQVLNGVETVIHDARPDYTVSPIPYANDVSISYDGTRTSFSAGTGQDVDRLFYVWDSTQHGYSYVDTRTWQVVGQWGSSGKALNQTALALAPLGIHDSAISRDGKWAELIPGTTPQLVVWQIGTLNVWAFSASGPNTAGIGSGGHDALGYSTYYDTDGSLTPTWLPQYYVSLPFGTFAPIKPLISTVMSGYTQDGSDYHLSANIHRPASNPFDSNPVIVSTEYVNNPAGIGVEPLALAPYMNEIDGLCTSCATPKVWRFAHTFDQYIAPSCCGVTGNVSGDGKWFVFTSNWACTRGLDSSGNCRTDVFIVNLQSAGSTAPGEEQP